ncbi:glycosyltransferase [Planktomarina temperata]|nr:glycosyltransferase [Planktomarina temperata]
MRETFDSLKKQTYKEFKVYVCVDGKDECVESILREYSEYLNIDMTINRQNIGLTSSLNILLEKSVEPLVARLDVEDVCHPSRFSMQIEEFKNNSSLVLCGSHFHSRSSDKIELITLPCDDFTIRSEIRKNNPFLHSAAMFKRLAGVDYDQKLKYTQDYDLWIRLTKHGAVANINHPLVTRSETNGISQKHEAMQLMYKVRVKLKHFKYLISFSLLLYLLKDIVKISFTIFKRLQKK